MVMCVTRNYLFVSIQQQAKPDLPGLPARLIAWQRWIVNLWPIKPVANELPCVEDEGASVDRSSILGADNEGEGCGHVVSTPPIVQSVRMERQVLPPLFAGQSALVQGYQLVKCSPTRSSIALKGGLAQGLGPHPVGACSI